MPGREFAGRGTRVLAFVTLLTLVIAACGSTASSAAPANTGLPTPLAAPAATLLASASASASATGAASPASSGNAGQTGRIEVPDQKFAITLPDGWTRLPLDSPALIQGLTSQLPPDSDLAKLVSGQAAQLAAAGIKLWAMDLSPEAVASGYGSNVNVIAQQPAPAGVTLDTLKSIATGQLSQLDAIGNLDAKVVRLPAGDAVRVTYDLNQPLGTGSALQVAGTQFYVIGNGNLYILSFSCAQAEAAACHDTADATMQTFELLG